MNKKFQEHVTSTAFALNLSKRMVRILLHLNGSGPEDERLNLAPYQALQRRGLATFKDGEGFSITKEGRLVAQLVECAGFSR